MSYEIREAIRWACVRLAVRFLRLTNRCKDEALSMYLHDVADEYARRPTGQWSGHE